MNKEEDNIRQHIDTKDLTNFELGEKIRIITKEISQMTKDFLKLAKETHDLYEKRQKRMKYISILRKDLSSRKND
jgi:hypothetical protein